MPTEFQILYSLESVTLKRQSREKGKWETVIAVGTHLCSLIFSHISFLRNTEAKNNLRWMLFLFFLRTKERKKWDRNRDKRKVVIALQELCFRTEEDLELHYECFRFLVCFQRNLLKGNLLAKTIFLLCISCLDVMINHWKWNAKLSCKLIFIRVPRHILWTIKMIMVLFLFYIPILAQELIPNLVYTNKSNDVDWRIHNIFEGHRESTCFVTYWPNWANRTIWLAIEESF